MIRITWLAASSGLMIASAVQAQLPHWPVDSRPVTTIGDADAPIDAQLLNVQSARRLRDGRVVVVNGNPLEVRLYGADGRMLRLVSRSGGGPGEVRYRADVLEGPGDSILLFSLGNHRLALFAPDGALAREWLPDAADAPNARVTLFHRAFIPWHNGSWPACARVVVDHLPASLKLREVLPDGTGKFWTREAGGSDWVVYSGGGQALGRATTPARFEVYQVDGDLLVGKTKDADDVETVVVLRVHAARTTGAAATCGAKADSIAAPSGPRVSELKAGLRNGLTAGEAYFSDFARYPQTWDDLRKVNFELPPDSELEILHTGAHGWSFMIADKKSPLSCVVSIGDGGFPDWPDGVLSCGS
jgi:hypothetical protein